MNYPTCHRYFERLFVLSLFMLIFQGCSHLFDGPIEETRSFTVVEAKDLYDLAINEYRTKVYDEEQSSNFYYRCELQPLWDEAVYSESELLCAYDVPTNDSYDYLASILCAEGCLDFYKASHQISIIKDKRTGNTSVYNRITIPTGEEDISDFPTCHEKERVSGDEFYSTISGYVISCTRYLDGKNVFHLFLGTDGSRNRVMESYIHNRYMHFYKTKKIATRVLDSYQCPECGREAFVETGYGSLFVCTHCGYAVFADELEGAYCYGEYAGGSISYGNGEDWVDPNPSGGGSSGVSSTNWSGTYFDDLDSDSMIELTYPRQGNIHIVLPERSEYFDDHMMVYLRFVSELDALYEDSVLASLLDALSSDVITLRLNFEIGPLAETMRSTSTIDIRYISKAVIAEELMHIFQYQNMFHSSPDGYYEFEAKCWLARAFSNSYLNTVFSGTSIIWSAASNYLSCRSSLNFYALYDALRYAGSYDMSNVTELTEMLPHIGMLDIENINPDE